jgi:hypothetical protein
VPHRRRGLRREEDRKKITLLDYYSPSTLVVIMTILVLSIADAFLTLLLQSHGAVELNPVMAYYLNLSATVFFSVKYGLTALSVIIVIILSHVIVPYLRLQARYLLNYLAGILALVVAWEFFLVIRFVL